MSQAAADAGMAGADGDGPGDGDGDGHRPQQYFYNQQPPTPSEEQYDAALDHQQQSALDAADEHGLDTLQSFGIDFGSMPIHFLAEGDDPPVITIPEQSAAASVVAADSSTATPAAAGERKLLPPVRVRRNYACGQCDFVTQNPRLYLEHMNEVHGQGMKIHECQLCSYASRHLQKVERHTATVHDPNREERIARRRAMPKPRRRDELLEVIERKEEVRQRKDLAKMELERHAKVRIAELTALMAERRARRREEARLARVARWAQEDREKEAAVKAAKAARAAPSATQTRPAEDGDPDDPETTLRPEPKPKLKPEQVKLAVKAPPRPLSRRPSQETMGSDDDDDEGRLVINDDPDASAPEDTDDDPDRPLGDESPDGDHEQSGESDEPDDNDDDDAPDENADGADAASSKVRDAPRGVQMDPELGLYKCSSCSFTSRTASLVVRHEGVVHLKRRFYRCSKCTYVTYLRSRYTKHYKYHLMPLIKCDDCDFSTPYRWNLDRHVKNHGGPGRHHCRGCNFATEIRQSLTVHQMNHHDPPIGPAPPRSRGQQGRQGQPAPQGPQGQQRRKFKVGSTLWTPPPADPEPQPAPRTPTTTPAAEVAAANASSTLATSSNAPDRLPAHQLLRCSLCAYRTPFVSNMSRHMHGVHGSTKPVRLPTAVAPTVQTAAAAALKTASAKRPVKPLPNLIPIQAVQAAPASTPPPPAAAETAAATNGDDGHDTSKKKNSFFDQLKLYPGTSGGASDLVCVHCGHEAKSLAELVRHNKLHQGGSRPLGTSTRCQHCRLRCKTSADLVQHLKTCPKAAAAAASVVGPDPAVGPGADVNEAGQGTSTATSVQSDSAIEAKATGAPAPSAAAASTGSEDADDEDADGEAASLPDGSVPAADPSLVGVETAPGYGLVTNQAEYEARAAKQNIVTSAVAPRKVFKCPHCPFWAATASRFHVHMVGHLNKKPFACSICKYRSNWRWDITKHIRIKEARDPEHVNAKTLMTDETGRRNYSKYNQHLILLKVAEPTADNLNPMYVAGPSTSRAGASGSQSDTPPRRTSEPMPGLPAPPKLTRAPAPRSSAQGSSSPSGNLLRPPPPLQAAAQSSSQPNVLPSGGRVGQTSSQQQQSLKRPADTPVPNVGSDPKKPNSDIKKTVWRCKQCHFRDGDRAVVLAHVKGHYRQQQEAAMAKLNKNTPDSQDAKSSNATTQSVLKKPFRCDTCPFVSTSEAAMQVHVNCHIERSDVFFKCFYCPFYVSTKEEVIQHMTVHQGVKGDSNTSEKISAAKSSTSQPPNSPSPSSTGKETPSNNLVTVKKEIPSFDQQDGSSGTNEDGQSSKTASAPPRLDFSNFSESALCWVLRDDKLIKMLRCRFCPHVNSRRANMLEHEKMHSKRPVDQPDQPNQHAYYCPECSYVCNNAGVLSSHTKVHYASYPQVYSLYDPYISETMQIKDIIEKFKLRAKISVISTPKVSPPKETNDSGPEKKLCGINVMSLLDPNQSLTDAVLAMKKKFNLELDGEPFAEPVDDSTETLPSPLKQLNDGSDPSAIDMQDEKQLHFCHLCPARFLSRQELGIHSRFHNLYLVHKCDHCSYTARQRPHLVAHFKVHSEDYQDRTSALMKMYKVHKEFPVPKIVCANIKPGLIGNPWIVVSSSSATESPPAPKFGCQKCPTAFFKNDALQAHLALHGSDNPHKCRICDYAVRTYGNLIKHMMSHGCKASVAKKILQGRMEVPESLRPAAAVVLNEVPMEPIIQKEEPQSPDELANHHGETSSDLLSQGSATVSNVPMKDDVNMETDTPSEAVNCVGRSDSEVKENGDSSSESPAPHKSSGFPSGSSDFVYPTSCRNGRVKVKKYKCQKCPSAFEKKDQYHIHMGLHGAKQRYRCTKCDYSVKFYANHVQHLRRHKASEEAKLGSKDDSESSNNEGEESIPDDTENIPSSSPPSPSRSAKTTGGKGEKLSVADKQAIMVLQQRRAKRSAESRESLDKNYWCSHCPYSSPRKDLVESHMRRHILVSGVRNTYVCDHCDYSVPIKHFLRDHTKLHFDVSKAPRPDAYMICDGLELYASSGVRKGKSKGKVLIFRDKGCNVTAERFLPPINCEGVEDNNDPANKTFINPLTFESESFEDNGVKENAETCADGENSEHEDLETKQMEQPVEVLGKENLSDVNVAEPVNVCVDSSSVNGTVQQNNFSSSSKIIEVEN